MSKELKISSCYLCNKPINPQALLESERPSGDHVPARLFYPKEYRAGGKLKRNLPQAPAHQGCNSQFKKDEEYFAMILSLLVLDQSPGGRALFQDLRHQMAKYPDKTRWFGKILKQIRYQERRTPTGIILPQKNMVFPIEGNRIDKIVWKIARGLYYLNFRKILPENLWHHNRVFPPGFFLPEFLRPHLKQVVTAGVHEEIFVYKYGYRTEGPKEHVIVMRFWQAIHFVVVFHEPDCACDWCIKKAAG